MESSFCHVVGVAKQVRLERIVRRDHPAEVKRPQGCLNRSLDSRAHPANRPRQTLPSRTRWAGKVPASTRRTRQPKPTSEPMGCLSHRTDKCPRPAARTKQELGTNGKQLPPHPGSVLALELTRHNKTTPQVQ